MSDKDGLEIQLNNAVELIKRYCIEMNKKNGNCEKCVFCSKGYNGCKLQTAPCEWEPVK